MREDCASVTAERNAWLRAVESKKPAPVRLFYDPFARYFLGPELSSIGDDPVKTMELLELWEQTVPGVTGSVLVRTRFIDHLLAVRLEEGVKQVVILGAGYDTRAYRFMKAGREVCFFELDHPATQKTKQDRLRQIPGKHPERLVYAPIVFESGNLSESLVSSGYLSDLKTFFILEGVSYYLTAGALNQILGFAAHQSGPGSSLVFDYWPPSVADGSCDLPEGQTLRAALALAGEVITWGLEPESLEDFLFQQGFSQVINLGSREYGQKITGHWPFPVNCSALFYFAHALRRGGIF